MHKRFKKSDDAVKALVPKMEKKEKESDDEIVEKVQVTDEMFEVAKVMGSVGNIKDLDMSLAKNVQTLNKQAGTAEITLIDIFQEGDIKAQKQTKRVDPKHMRFDFNSDEDFNPDTDTAAVSKKAFDWILNPLGSDYFHKEVKDKKIMII